MNTTNSVREIRWKWILPTVAVVLTAGLMMLADRQDRSFWIAHPGISDTPWEFQPPARFFEQLINGAGFYFPIPFYYFDPHRDFVRLFGVALFWFWIGWALDRKLRGVRAPIIQSRLLRAASYVALLGLACSNAWRYFEELSIHGQVPLIFPRHILHDMMNPYFFYDSSLGIYLGLGWSMFYAIYFVWRFVVTFKS